jgi:hypothetical protein
MDVQKRLRPTRDLPIRQETRRAEASDMDTTTRTPHPEPSSTASPASPAALDTRSARAWHRSLPTYARNEIDVSLLHEVDRLPRSLRREVLTKWTRASCAGLYDSQLLRTIVEVVVADPAQPLPIGA